jgi:hypothetical protein
MKRCPECATRIDDNRLDVNCPNCGAAVMGKCPVCGAIEPIKFIDAGICKAVAEKTRDEVYANIKKSDRRVWLASSLGFALMIAPSVLSFFLIFIPWTIIYIMLFGGALVTFGAMFVFLVNDIKYHNEAEKNLIRDYREVAVLLLKE